VPGSGPGPRPTDRPVGLLGAQIVGRFARDRVALEAAAFLERARRIGLEMRLAGTPSSTPIAVTLCLVLVHQNQIKMCLHLRPQVQPQCTITLGYGTTVENFTYKYH
jgi:hypothetical protein